MLLSVPLISEGRLLGFTIIVRNNTPFPVGRTAILKAIKAEAAPYLANAILHRRISELASVDDLTCILNRCFGLRRFREEFSNASYGNKSLGVILLDVDHFKAVNDTLT